MGKSPPNSGRAFPSVAHFRTCGKVWFSRVRWPRMYVTLVMIVTVDKNAPRGYF